MALFLQIWEGTTPEDARPILAIRDDRLIDKLGHEIRALLSLEGEGKAAAPGDELESADP